MGYTYNDFVSAANGAGLMEKFSPEDIETTRKNPEYGLSMLGFMRDAQNATTPEQRALAEASADQLRKSYQTAASYGSMPQFTYDKESQYKQLLDKVSNPAEFSYDVQQDDTYKAARAAYLREGERASTNALVRASAATGGVPSSYAVSAATQAGDYYAGQAADLIPTMEQNAYQRYLSGLDADRAALSAVEGARATAYSQFLDRLSLQRQQEQDALTRQQLEQQQAQQEYNNALAMYQLLGYATPEIAATLGIPEGALQMAAPVGGNSGAGNSGYTGGTGYTGGGVDNGGYDNSVVAGIQERLKDLGANIAADGLWGPQSQAEAMRILNVSSVADVEARLNELDALDAQGDQGDQGDIGGYPKLTADFVAQLQEEYPNRVIPDYVWEKYVSTFGLKQLQAVNFRSEEQVVRSHGSKKPNVRERM